MPISKDGPCWWLLYEPKLPLSEHTTKIDGVELYYRMAGSGPPLLLLHGRTGSGQIWMPHLDALGERYTVIVPDLPGHGRSTAFLGRLSLTAASQG